MPSSCWVETCSNRLCKGGTVKMFRFPHSNPERLERWIVKLGRLPPEGQRSNRLDGLRQPKDHDRICSDHFVKGKPSNDPSDPDYIPTIFKKEKIKHARLPRKKTDKLNHIPNRQERSQNQMGIPSLQIYRQQRKLATEDTSVNEEVPELEQEVAKSMILLSCGQVLDKRSNTSNTFYQNSVPASVNLELYETKEQIGDEILQQVRATYNQTKSKKRSLDFACDHDHVDYFHHHYKENKSTTIYSFDDLTSYSCRSDHKLLDLLANKRRHLN